MFGDIETSLTLMTDLESQNLIKHINVIYNHIWGLVDNGELVIE